MGHDESERGSMTRTGRRGMPILGGAETISTERPPLHCPQVRHAPSPMEWNGLRPVSPHKHKEGP